MILLVISFILDTIIPNIFKNFIPFCTLSAIIVISFLYEEDKYSYILLFIFGVIYDLFNTDLLFFHGLIFMLIYFFRNRLFKNRNNFFIIMLSYYSSILLYCVMILIISVNFNIDYFFLIKMVMQSLCINTIYFIIVYLLFLKIKCLFKNTIKKRSY